MLCALCSQRPAKFAVVVGKKGVRACSRCTLRQRALWAQAGSTSGVVGAILTVTAHLPLARGVAVMIPFLVPFGVSLSASLIASRRLGRAWNADLPPVDRACTDAGA